MDPRRSFSDLVVVAFIAIAIAFSLFGCVRESEVNNEATHFESTLTDCLSSPNVPAECEKLFRYCDQNPVSKECDISAADMPIPGT